MHHPNAVQLRRHGLGFLDYVVTTSTLLLRLSYFRMYRKNTLEPALSFCKENDDAKLQDLLKAWIRVKKSELEYVQIAVWHSI
jgi:hypothetical protein